MQKGGTFLMPLPGFTACIVTLKHCFSDLTLSDSGLYTCQAKSKFGQAVWSASLQVADPNLDPTVTFNSMPYLSQFPASPSKPQMVNATATSITLKWDKPHRIGGSALQGYQVNTYRKRMALFWRFIPSFSVGLL